MIVSHTTQPLRLGANQPAARFYEGGGRISKFRNEPSAQPRTPEDWVGSSTSVRGAAPAGLSQLPDGELLVSAIGLAPLDWLGPAHVARYGADPMMLVKLLDAGQRLPIHAHPDAEFASSMVGAVHGKAEAWYILEGGIVYLGLKEPLTFAQLHEVVSGQDTDTLLDLMHSTLVAPHDTVYVPPGLLHSIGEGIFLVEVQEPEDLSILLEWDGFDLDGNVDGHLGLGFEVALTAVETRSRTRDEAFALVQHPVGDGPVLVKESRRFFRLDRISQYAELSAGLAVVISLEGSMILATDGGAITDLPHGTTTLVPYGAGTMKFSGPGTVLVARPPR